jgi:hypothetical protein
VLGRNLMNRGGRGMGCVTDGSFFVYQVFLLGMGVIAFRLWCLVFGVWCLVSRVGRCIVAWFAVTFLVE